MCHGSPVSPQLRSILLGGMAITLMAISAADGAEKKGSSMSYGEAREFLAKHTNLVELTNDAGARVAVAPEWQGRVMTSTCGGLDGPSFGFVNRDFIEAGKTDPHFNNMGAEERLWLCPEGGQFSLWFKPGAKQVMANWFTPPALNDGAWKVVAGQRTTRPHGRAMKLQNTAATAFELDVTRDVRLLGADDFQTVVRRDGGRGHGAKPGVKMVAYETANQITNRGPAFSKQKGLVSIWILGMMNAGPQTVIIVPYRSGADGELGPVVKSDYFGAVPRRSPEGHAPSRALPRRRQVPLEDRHVAAARPQRARLDRLRGGRADAGPFHHARRSGRSTNYMNNMWQVPQAQPYTGDVANAYNDGPNDLGKRMGSVLRDRVGFARAGTLKTGESLLHRHRTIHIQADAETLRKLAKETLGVDLDAVRKEMLAN